MKINISKVFNDIEESATLAINQNIKSLRTEGKKIYHLGFGESPFPVPETVKQGLNKGAGLKSYQPTQGILELREHIAEFYQQYFNLVYHPDNIFIGPGSKELIFDLMLLLEGDLILPVPSWVSYIPQAKIAGKSVIRVNTKFENAYCMTPDELECNYNAAIKKGLNPRIMLINSPGNPCGNSYSEHLVKELTDLAREKNIWLISDEIYGNIIFEGYKHTSFATYYPEGTFVTGGISKDRSLGGYRLGVCLVPEGQTEFKKAFNTLISETFSCVSAPIQYAGINAYTINPEMTEFISTCTKIHNTVLKYFYNKIIKSNYITCNPPMGAFYLYPRFNLSKCSTSMDLAKILLAEYNVATLPGNCFGVDPSELNLRLAVTDYDGAEAYKYFKSSPTINAEEFVENYCPNLVTAANLLVEMAEAYA